MSYETAPIEVIEGEIVPITVDASDVLDPADVIQSVAVSLYEATLHTLVIGGAFLESPAFTGQVLNITIDARELRAHDRYRLIGIATVSPNEKVVGIVTPITCVT